jgi:hypothetical protein
MPKTKKRKCKKNGGEPPEKKYLITNPTKQDFIDVFGEADTNEEHWHWKNKDIFFLYKFPLSKQTMNRIYFTQPDDDHDGQLYSYAYINKHDCNDPYSEQKDSNVHTDTDTILCEGNYINKYKSLLDKSNPFSRTYDKHSTGNKVLRFLNKYKPKNKELLNESEKKELLNKTKKELLNKTKKEFFNLLKDNKNNKRRKKNDTISPLSITDIHPVFHSINSPRNGGKKIRKTRKRKTRKTYTKHT